jgi:phosphate transport system permease protein
MSITTELPRPSRPQASLALLRHGDLILHICCLAAALCIPAVIAFIVFYLCHDSLPSIRAFGVSFFTSSEWDTTKLQFGAVPFMWGTLITSILAMLIAVPFGVGAATFLAEIAAGWVRRGASFLIELLAAIPSVVYGFWGIFYLVPVMQVLFGWLHVENTSGRGIFTASVILAIMIVPYIAAITYDVCRAVPQSQRQGALALGSTRWQMIWRVVLPYARPGILGGCVLALGRAIGETMAVAMVIGNRTIISWNIFDAGATIPSVIANELPTASRDLHKSAMIELGLALLLVTVVVNCLARVLMWRVGQPKSGFNLFRRLPRPASNVLADGEAVAPAPHRVEPSPRSHRRAQLANTVMTGLLGVCLIVTLIPLFHIFGYITYRGFSSVSLDFFTHLPNDDVPGLGHALLGSAIMVGMATIAAVPIGLLAALYLTEYRTSRFVPPVRFVCELLGGVPSIIVGIFAYALLVQPFGFSAWAGATALAVIMLPIVVRASEEALKLVPTALRNASYALGASHAQTVVRIIVPTALPNIITGVFLAIARIAGETAPLLFTAYNSNFWPKSLSSRMPNLTYYIYNYSLSDNRAEQREAWAGALVLLVLVMLLNVGIRIVTGKRVLQATRAD